MIPTIGRTVIVENAAAANDSNTHPAVVTRVCGQGKDTLTERAGVLVNLTILPDLGMPRPQGSVRLFESREWALEHYAKGDQVTALPAFAYWPPRD